MSTSPGRLASPCCLFHPLTQPFLEIHCKSKQVKNFPSFGRFYSWMSFLPCKLLLLPAPAGHCHWGASMGRGAGSRQGPALLSPHSLCSQGSGVTTAFPEHPALLNRHLLLPVGMAKHKSVKQSRPAFLVISDRWATFQASQIFLSRNMSPQVQPKVTFFFFFLISAECKDNKCKYKGKNILLEQYSLFSTGEQSISNISTTKQCDPLLIFFLNPYNNV